ncbi:MAG: MurR/RpiR family transcriptional regulator [Alphaproteobacteria bacterium]
MDAGALRERLEAAYPQLSPQLRGAARFVLKEPESVALYPLRDVAGRAGVSPAALVRLAGHLGFDGWRAFRDVLRDGLHSAAAHYSRHAQELLGGRGRFAAVWRAAGEAQAANIATMLRTIPAAAVEAAGRCLADARRLYLLGLRSNYAATFHFHYVLRTFADDVVLLDGAHGMLVDEIAGIGPRDALLAVSYDPYAVDAVTVVRAARASGARIVALTDHKLSPIADGADHLFLVPTVGASFYQSLVPTMILLEALVCFLVARGGRAAVDRVEAEFRRREGFGIYWRDGGE